jgi:glycoside/pentoside/hexuronide:cation symporter, GPH family
MVARMSAPRLLVYGLPAIPLAMLTGPVFAALPTYFVRELGQNLQAIGLAFVIARLWDALCDPMVGVLGDRLTSRFGRRRPLMLAGLPLVGIGGLFLLVLAPSLTPLTVTLWSILLYTGWTLIKLSHDAWGAELSPDYAERLRITGWREGLALLGGIIAIVLIGWGQLPNGPGFGTVFPILYGLVMALLIITVPLLVWRIADPVIARRKEPPLRAQAKALWANQALRQLSVAFLLNGLAAAFPGTLFLLFVEHVLGRPDLQGPLIMLYFFSAVLAVPLWTWAGQRWGKHRAWLASMLIACAAFAPVAFFLEGFEIWFALVCVITGICLAGDLMLPPAIQADVLDEDRVATGTERAGLLFAWLGLLSKFAYALPIGIAFPLLAWAGFSASAGAVNDESAVRTLAVLYGAVPVVLKLLACWSLKGFPLDAARQRALRATLAKA